MDNMTLDAFIDHQRWLIENGLFTDLAKDNLYLYGSLVHVDIEAVHAVIDAKRSLVSYTLYARPTLIDAIAKFNKLRESKKILDLWRLKRILKRNGTLDFLPMLNRFVKDFCGPKWSAEMKIEDIATYVEEPDEPRNEINSGVDK